MRPDGSGNSKNGGLYLFHLCIHPLLTQRGFRQDELLSGPIGPKFLAGAQSFEEGLDAEPQQELPYLISDGNMIALTQMVSDNQVRSLLLAESHH